MWYLRYEIILVLAISTIVLSESGGACNAHCKSPGCSSISGKAVHDGSVVLPTHDERPARARDERHDLYSTRRAPGWARKKAWALHVGTDFGTVRRSESTGWGLRRGAQGLAAERPMTLRSSWAAMMRPDSQRATTTPR